MKEVFKGYAKGDGKKPAQKVKDDDLISFEEASKYNSYGAKLNEGYIDISFDSEEMSDKFRNMLDENNWNCLILENPSNGHIHSYWKIPERWTSKDGKDKKLAVGFIADIHSKGTYIPLKVDGVQREVEFEPDQIDEVPDELFPVQTNISLMDLEEGDGRNDTLFRYILVLQTQLTMHEESIKGVLNNINQFILKEPLSSKELETITRDEAFTKPIFFNGKNFMFNRFGDYMIHEHHIKRINGQLHCYKNGIYIAGSRYIENLMLKEIPTLKANQRTEVLKYIEVMIPDDEDVPMQENLIAFKNGVLDFKKDQLLPFSPEYLVTNMIPWDYNPEAYSELMDNTLNKISCFDKEIRLLLEECSGYCMYRKNILSKSFFLTGTGSNGKSTFLEALKSMLGIKNVSSLELDELGDRFSSVMMVGKLANIGDDISNRYIEGKTLSVFKKVVTANTIKIEHKGVDAVDFKPYTKLLFSANEIPKMKTGGFDAIKRRLAIIPFNAKFSKDDPDFNPNINDDLRTNEAMEYLIRISIEGLKRALNNKGFTESQKVQNELDEFERDNNPILEWLEEVDESEILHHTGSDVYARYDTYCHENGLDKMDEPKFKKIINNKFQFKLESRKIPDGYGGKRSARVFVKK